MRHFGVIFVSENPLVMTILSCVPFSAPVGMPVRMFFGEAQWGEPLVSLALLVGFTAIEVLIASRVFSLHFGTAMNDDHDRAEILRLYETSRRGHLEGDAAKLLAQYGAEWDDLSGGTVVVRKLSEELRRLTGVLDGTRFVAWDDITPPRVEVSADRSMAWLLGEIAASAIQSKEDGTQSEISYRCSWLQVYVRRDDRWAAIVNAPSVLNTSE